MKDIHLNLKWCTVTCTGQIKNYQTNFFDNNNERYNLIIDNVIEGWCANSIGEEFFRNRNCIESIEIKEGIKSIENYAFSNCKNLKFVKFPKTIEYIDKNAFANTPWLEKMKVQNEHLIFGDSTLFGSNEKIKCIAVPNEIEKIAVEAYRNSNIESIEMGDNVTSIGKFAFENCKKLETIKLSNNIKTIRYGTFDSCENLNNVILPKSIKRIDDYAFNECKKLNNIYLPEGLEKIGSYAFNRCKTLKKIDIPSSVTEISGMAFEGCKNLVIRYKGNEQNLKKLLLKKQDLAFGIDNIKIISTYDIDNFINKLSEKEKIEENNIPDLTSKDKMDYFIENLDNRANKTTDLNEKLMFLTIREQLQNTYNNFIESSEER